MSDVETLLTKFERGELLRPTPDRLNIVDLSRALACLAGVEGVPCTPGAAELAARIGPAEHLIFVLADGLGMTLLEALPRSTFLAAHLATELRTIFPSTTATVLTALATGAWPNSHAVTGQWTHLPEIGGAGALLPFVARAGGRSLAQQGVTVEGAFPLPPILRDARRDLLALLPQWVANTRSSAYFSGGHPRRPYRSLTEAIDLLIARVEAADGPTYTYLYALSIDLEAHRHGLDHPNVRAAVYELDRELERLTRRLGGRACLVLTADHGLLDTPPLAKHWLRPAPDLFASLRCPPSGDTRVMYLHARPGAQDGLRRRFRGQYGDRFCLLTVEEAEALGLFGPGPLSPVARERLGDLILVSAGADVLEYVPNGSIDRVLAVSAHHSGLTPSEMRVPLVIAGGDTKGGST
jgi:hypothetical protein